MYYRILVQECSETGEVKTIHDDNHKNIMMLAECDDNSMVTEMLVNVSIARAASTIAQSKHFFAAAKLAVLGKFLMERENGEDEEEGVVQ